MTRLGKHGDVQGAIDLLEDMASYSLRPNREVMNLLIKICGEHGRGNQALHLFNRVCLAVYMLWYSHDGAFVDEAAWHRPR